MAKVSGADSVQETYSYDANSARVKRTRGGATTVYIGMLYEVDQATGASNSYYTLDGQMVAMRGRNAQGTSVTYLHGDHLGSISVATSATGTVLSRQEYTPWGSVRSGNIAQTTLDFTGQRRDDTGLMFLNARYYDPVLARFVSADSIVPGMASGSGGAAMTLGSGGTSNLTVDFHETGFVGQLNGHNAFTQQNGFAFQLSGEARQQAESPHGPMNPQALNRYSYTLNNLVRYVDPSGHWIESALDVAAILYDIWDIKQNGINWVNALSLGADVLSLIVPFFAGGGAAVRAVARLLNAGRYDEAAEAIIRASCSFSADTVVATADGGEAIGDVEVGDQVLAYDEATGMTGLYTVTAVLVHLDPTLVHLTIDSEQIETTPEHPFYTKERGWVVAGELRVGDQVRQADGGTGTVMAVEVVERRQVMYNLTVAVAHTFFVGDGQWLVHNSCGTRVANTITRHGGKLVAGGYYFPNRRAALQAASEIAGDLGSDPATIRMSQYRGHHGI